MAKGDNIFVFYPPITHHGIDCGDGSVIHYDKQKGVCKISKTEFAKGKQIHVQEYDKCNTGDVVVQRAEEKLNERKYNLLFNNCEHFACYCKTGKKESGQINLAEKIAGAAIGVVNTGGHLAKEAAAKAAMDAVNPMGKALIGLGLKQAPKVAGNALGGIAAAGGLAGGVAADLVVGKILEDDESLSEHEREARKKAKVVGKVAAMAGNIAGAGGVAIGVAAPAVLGVGIGLGGYYLLKDNQE